MGRILIRAIFLVLITFLPRTRSGDYKKCVDQLLKEVMVQIDNESFVSVRYMRELLPKVTPDRKYIDSYMINNVRILTRKKKLELENTNIKIDPK